MLKPSLESIDADKYLARDIPNFCAGLGFITDEIALFLNSPYAFAFFVRIFSPDDVYPNSPETTTKSPGFAPFLPGSSDAQSSENPIILQSIISSLDSLVSPPTILTPNSLEAI